MPASRDRTGYASTMTLGQRLKAGLLGKPNDDGWFEHWQRVCAMRVDGTALYDTAIRLRGPSPHETRLAEKFGEAMLAAHALARLDPAEVDIDTGGATPRESPDLLVLIDGVRRGVEVAEIIPNAYRENVSFDFNLELSEIIDADESLWPNHAFLQVTRKPGRYGREAMSRETRDGLKRCILEYLRSGDYREWATKPPTYRHEWPGAEFGYNIWIGCVRNKKGLVHVDDQRGSFDGNAMVTPALTTLKNKRDKAAKYDRSLPLWLVLGITEQWGLFRSSLEHLDTLTPDIDPFERVIIHDHMTYVTYPSRGASRARV